MFVLLSLYLCLSYYFIFHYASSNCRQRMNEDEHLFTLPLAALMVQIVNPYFHLPMHNFTFKYHDRSRCKFHVNSTLTNVKKSRDKPRKAT